MRYRVSLDKATVLAIFPYSADNACMKEMVENYKKSKTFHSVDRYYNFLIWADANGKKRLYAVHSPERTLLKKLNKYKYVNT